MLRVTDRSDGVVQKVALIILDKLLLAVAGTFVLAVLQYRLEISQERLAKARQINDIAVDRPLTIAAGLPPLLDQYILCATRVRTAQPCTTSGLPDLQIGIDSSLQGGQVFFDKDRELTTLANKIHMSVAVVTAKALTTNTISASDMDALEDTRHNAYRFHRRVADLCIDRVLHSSVGIEREVSLWRRLFGADSTSG